MFWSLSLGYFSVSFRVQQFIFHPTRNPTLVWLYDRPIKLLLSGLKLLSGSSHSPQCGTRFTSSSSCVWLLVIYTCSCGSCSSCLNTSQPEFGHHNWFRTSMSKASIISLAYHSESHANFSMFYTWRWIDWNGPTTTRISSPPTPCPLEVSPDVWWTCWVWERVSDPIFSGTFEIHVYWTLKTDPISPQHHPSYRYLNLYRRSLFRGTFGPMDGSGLLFHPKNSVIQTNLLLIGC
jgi:hypothetical protein